MRKVGVNGHGRRVGESHHRAKLSDHDVELILACLEPDENGPGLSLGQVARKFGLSKSHVRRIAEGLSRGQRAVRWRAVKQ